MDALKQRSAPASAPRTDIDTSSLAPAATPHHGITIGAGLDRPQGKLLLVQPWTAQALADALQALTGIERWWCSHVFAGDYRQEARWQVAVALAVDLDWHDVEAPTPAGKQQSNMPAEGWHSALPAEAAQALQAAAHAGDLSGNLFHLTTRGCRVVALLSEPCSAAATFEAAIAAFGQQVLADVAALGLAHDGTRGCTFDTSATDRARLFYVPRATVNAQVRNAQLVVIRAKLDSAEAWVQAAPSETAPAEVAEQEPEARAPKALPPVPWHALPHNLGDYGRALSANMEASEPAVFAAMLVAASAIVPATSEIEGRNGHREKCPLWINILALPGSRKSDAIDRVCEPLEMYDRALETANQAAKAEWETECRALRASAPKGKMPELPPPPARVQTKIDDFTTESMIDLFCAAEPYGLALLCAPDEVTSVIGGLNQYKHGGNDRQRLLKIWGGRPYRVDRKGKHSRANRPRMALIAGVQPRVACELHRADTADGFLDRFAWIDCRNEREPNYDTPPMPPAQERAWHDALRFHLPEITVADLRRPDDPEAPDTQADYDAVVHTLAPAAVPLWREFYNSVDRRPLPPLLKGYAGKYCGQVLRVARALHYLKHRREAVRVLQVDAETIAAAIEIGRWLWAQTVAVRTFMAGGLQVSGPAWKLMAWLVKQQGRRAKLRDCYRAGVRGIGTVAQAEAAGNELEKAGVAVWSTLDTVAGRECRELILVNQGAL